MEDKRKVNNLSSATVIFRASNPSEIFLEIKDDGYPLKLARNNLCLIGGNWIGDGAKNDRGPLDTVRREVQEEITLKRSIQNDQELANLGLGDAGAPVVSRFAKDVEGKASERDLSAIEQLKMMICEGLIPFGDFFKTITKQAMLDADPECKKDTFSSLSSCWAVALREDGWADLRRLQEKYGNLSDESVSILISLNQIIDKRIKAAFGYDRILQDFFLAMGFAGAVYIPLVEHIEVERLGLPLATYADYMERYDIGYRP